MGENSSTINGGSTGSITFCQVNCASCSCVCYPCQVHNHLRLSFFLSTSFPILWLTLLFLSLLVGVGYTSSCAIWDPGQVWRKWLARWRDLSLSLLRFIFGNVFFKKMWEFFQRERERDNEQIVTSHRKSTFWKKKREPSQCCPTFTTLIPRRSLFRDTRQVKIKKTFAKSLSVFFSSW